MNLTVYTVIVNDYDELKAPPIVELGVRYICFSDRPQDCPPWEIRDADLPYADSRRNSRLPKILAHRYIDSQYSIYHDASCVTATEPTTLIDEFLSETDLAIYCHPRRQSLYEERDACARLGVCSGAEIDGQVERYRARGIGPGLWSGGIILRRHTEKVRAFNERWWQEYADGCYRDQIALPCAIQESGIPIRTIQGNITADPHRFKFHFHRKRALRGAA